MSDSHSIIGQTNFRRQHVSFGIRQADRLLHMYIIGQTGVGKSTLIEQLALQDAAADRGFAVIDPHGDMVSGYTRGSIPQHGSA